VENETKDGNILMEAEAAVAGPRQHHYGNPTRNLTRIAMMWSAILGRPITNQEVCMCMIAVKLGRLTNSQDHRDSWIDIAGYARVWELASGNMNPPGDSFAAGEEA
jgi:hypothetical protein